MASLEPGGSGLEKRSSSTGSGAVGRGLEKRPSGRSSASTVARRIRRAVARVTSTPSAYSDPATTWIFLPSRTIRTSAVRGVSGVGRIRSVVSRASCIGTRLGVVSISVARSAAGDPPNCAPGSQGPWQ